MDIDRKKWMLVAIGAVVTLLLMFLLWTAVYSGLIRSVFSHI
jgi:hypothetical protein